MVDTSKPTGNAFLDSLSAPTRSVLLPTLQIGTLRRGQVLGEPGIRIEAVYFPIRSVVSTLTRMLDGGAVEVGLAGHEGMSGISLVYGTRESVHSTIVQVADSAYCLAADAFMQQLNDDAAFKERVLAYAGYSFVAATQFAACNRLHPIEERYARWILMADDRIGLEEFPLTQEFTAQMLGVRRAGVTVVAGTLSNAGLISYRRGHVSVLDRPALEDVACECYRAVNAELRRFMDYGPTHVSVAGLNRHADPRDRSSR